MPEDPLNPGHMAPVKTPMLDAFNSGIPEGGWKFDMDAGFDAPQDPLQAMEQKLAELNVVAGPGVKVTKNGLTFMVATVPEVKVQMIPEVVAEEEVAATTVHPLQLIDATSGGVAKVRVRYGTVAEEIADAGMSVGDDPAFEIAVATGYVWVEFPVLYDADTGSWSKDGACVIDNGAALPTATDTLAYKEIGSVVVTGTDVTSIAQNITGSQGWERCGPNPGWTDTFQLQ